MNVLCMCAFIFICIGFSCDFQARAKVRAGGVDSAGGASRLARGRHICRAAISLSRDINIHDRRKTLRPTLYFF